MPTQEEFDVATTKFNHDFSRLFNELSDLIYNNINTVSGDYNINPYNKGAYYTMGAIGRRLELIATTNE